MALPAPSCFPKALWEPALDGGQVLSSLRRRHTGGVFFSQSSQSSSPFSSEKLLSQSESAQGSEFEL